MSPIIWVGLVVMFVAVFSFALLKFLLVLDDLMGPRPPL